MRVLICEGEWIYLCADRCVVGVSLSTGAHKEYRCAAAGEECPVSACLGGGFLFAAFSGKHVCCWNIDTAEVLGSHVLKKRAMTIAHAGGLRLPSSPETERDLLVVADRAGEIYVLGAPLLKSSVGVAGHTASVVTDLAVLGNRLVTADRDEKVRISWFPQAALIQSYCLGHTSVVASVCGFVSKNGAQLLASSSWDHTIRFWETETGACCGKLELGEGRGSEGGNVGDVGNGEGEGEGEGQGEGEGEEEGEGESQKVGEGDDEAEKAYNEQQAGHYPIKVVAHALASDNLLERVAVFAIFRNKPEVFASIGTRTGAAAQFEFSPPSRWIAPALPLDLALFREQGKVAVLLPHPHYLAVLSIGDAGWLAPATGAATEAALSFAQRTLAQVFPDGVELSQQTFSGGGGGGDEDGGQGAILLKHSLDRPFRHGLTGVALETGAKLGKRSRKRPIDSVGVDHEAVLEAAQRQTAHS